MRLFLFKASWYLYQKNAKIWYDNKLIALNLWHVYLVVSVCWEFIVTHMLYLIETTTPLISKKKFNVFMVQKGSGNNKLLPSSLATHMYENKSLFLLFYFKTLCVWNNTITITYWFQIIYTYFLIIFIRIIDMKLQFVFVL